MKYFDQALQLLAHSNEKLEEIRAAYNESIAEQEVKPKLLIEIKNFLENLRSALDFSAHGLVEKYGTMPKDQKQIYFPYASASDDITKFRKKVNRSLPGVAAVRQDILERIELAQHFYGPGSNWLQGFMELTNKNKHQSLTPQKRGRFTEIRFSIEIPANTTIEIPWPPKPEGPGETEVSTFDTFAFTSNGIPVIPYLEMNLECIERLVTDLSKM
jgi:hypothetical protein